MTRTTLSAWERSAILNTLTDKTPQALRQMLIEPDYVVMHDFHLARSAHDELVREALRFLT